MHAPEYSLKLSRPFAHHSGAFSIVVAANQIAESALVNRPVQAVCATRISAIPVRNPGVGSEKGWLADGPRGSKAKGAVLQTVAIGTPNFGYAAGG
jgi:hypothetical protein